MKRHHHLDPSVNDGLPYHTQDPDQTYPPGVRFTFGKQYQYGPTQMCQYNDRLPHVLYQIHQFLPSVQVGGRFDSLTG